MAETSYLVGDSKTVKLWSRKLFSEMLKETWASRFIGVEDNNVVQILKETSKTAGDQVTVPIRAQLTGRGVQGDATLEGNEEAQTVYSDALVINQLRHAVRSGGKMSQQRVTFDMRKNCYDGLKDWFAGRIDTWFFNQLAGNTVQTDTIYTGNQAAISVDTNHHIWAGSGVTDAASLGSTNTFTLNLLDKAVNRATTLDTATSTGLVPIRPIMMNGDPHFIVFLHPHQVYSLKADSGSTGWLEIQKAAMAGMQASKSPVFTGALGVYNRCILHEAQRLPLAVAAAGTAVSSTRRALLCGAQAGIMAFGQESGLNQIDWVEELFDYKNKFGVAATAIAGLKKTRINSLDFGVIAIDTYAAAP